jgi:hypothetical protein
MWQDILRIAMGWGGVALLVVFWYRVMRGIGTF